MVNTGGSGGSVFTPGTGAILKIRTPMCPPQEVASGTKLRKKGRQEYSVLSAHSISSPT